MMIDISRLGKRRYCRPLRHRPVIERTEAEVKKEKDAQSTVEQVIPDPPPVVKDPPEEKVVDEEPCAGNMGGPDQPVCANKPLKEGAITTTVRPKEQAKELTPGGHTVTSSEVEKALYLSKLAEMLKEVYIKKYLITTGGKSPPGKRFESSWIRVAEKVLLLDADPYLYIEAQFRGVGLKEMSRFPYPSELYGEGAEARYKNVSSGGWDPFRSDFKMQATYAAHLSEAQGRPLDDVLMDPKSGLSAYARVLFCSSGAVGVALANYGDKAKAELQLNPGLRAYVQKNYETRYERVFPKRISTRPTGEHTEDAGTLVSSKVRGPRPKRRKRNDT